MISVDEAVGGPRPRSTAKLDEETAGEEKHRFLRHPGVAPIPVLVEVADKPIETKNDTPVSYGAVPWPASDVSKEDRRRFLRRTIEWYVRLTDNCLHCCTKPI